MAQKNNARIQMGIRSVSPIDGRYEKKTEILADYFSEMALIKYRITTEIVYLKYLSSHAGVGLRKFTAAEIKMLDEFCEISVEDAEIVKQIETKGYNDIPATNHDVKAIEYFIKLKLSNTSLNDVLEMVHFSLTSEDINNISMGMMIRDVLNEVIMPHIEDVYTAIYTIAESYAASPMLARTHGQPASPVTFGKEMLVFVARIKEEIATLSHVTILAKLNGATGGFNAHNVVFPDIDWISFSKGLIEEFNKNRTVTSKGYFKNIQFKLRYNPVTTQIESHDSFARIFDGVKRINTIMIDYCQDIWRYISDGWIKQKAVKGEIGSSAMPHKVNPIDFENAEGNLGIANALFGFFANKLQISRLQRDLTDSTVQRNIGVAFGHSIISYSSILKGMSKISVDTEKILEYLKNTPEVIAEAYQNVLRFSGVEKPYELLKDVTRGKKVTIADFTQLVDKLTVSDEIKKKLYAILPENYIGLSERIVKEFDPQL